MLPRYTFRCKRGSGMKTQGEREWTNTDNTCAANNKSKLFPFSIRAWLFQDGNPQPSRNTLVSRNPNPKPQNAGYKLQTKTQRKFILVTSILEATIHIFIHPSIHNNGASGCFFILAIIHMWHLSSIHPPWCTQMLFHPTQIYTWNICPSIHPSKLVHTDVVSSWAYIHMGHLSSIQPPIHPSTMVHLDVVPSQPNIHMGHLSSSQPASHQKWCILMLFYPSHIYTWGIFHPSIHNGACGCSFILAMYTHGASLIHSSIHRQWCIWIHFHHGYIYMVSQPSIHPSIHPFV